MSKPEPFPLGAMVRVIKVERELQHCLGMFMRIAGSRVYKTDGPFESALHNRTRYHLWLQEVSGWDPVTGRHEASTDVETAGFPVDWLELVDDDEDLADPVSEALERGAPTGEYTVPEKA